MIPFFSDPISMKLNGLIFLLPIIFPFISNLFFNLFLLFPELISVLFFISLFSV